MVSLLPAYEVWFPNTTLLVYVCHIGQGVCLISVYYKKRTIISQQKYAYSIVGRSWIWTCFVKPFCTVSKKNKRKWLTNFRPIQNQCVTLDSRRLKGWLSALLSSGLQVSLLCHGILLLLICRVFFT